MVTLAMASGLLATVLCMLASVTSATVSVGDVVGDGVVGVGVGDVGDGVDGDAMEPNWSQECLRLVAVGPLLAQIGRRWSHLALLLVPSSRSDDGAHRRSENPASS